MELLTGPKPPADSKPIGSRYDHQISVFGAAAQARLQSQNVFLVGCGALGCEYIKAFALMGLGTKGGSVHMTDDDRIELSNLSRQFLFRRRHVGHSKVRRETHNQMQMHWDRGWLLRAPGLCGSKGADSGCN
jgi:ubiquitin-activating enzyme E1